MRTRLHPATRVAATIIASAGLVGATVAGTGDAAADGFPDGPYCYGPAKVMAESNLSQVVICPTQSWTGWSYSGKAKVTGATLDIRAAVPDDSGTYHAYNDGYQYHVTTTHLLITAPDGSTVSYEPWTYYDSTEDY